MFGEGYLEILYLGPWCCSHNDYSWQDNIKIGQGQDWKSPILRQIMQI